MLGKKVNPTQFSLGLAFFTAIAFTNNAFAQNSPWFFPVMPWQTYYSAPSYSAPTYYSGSYGASPMWVPSCANGSCGMRQAPVQRMPVNPQPPYSVQPNYGTGRPTFQPTPPASQPVASRPTTPQARTWQPTANPESPYYEYREAPTRQSAPATQPTRKPLPTQAPIARNQNDNSPYYP